MFFAVEFEQRASFAPRYQLPFKQTKAFHAKQLDRIDPQQKKKRSFWHSWWNQLVWFDYSPILSFDGSLLQHSRMVGYCHLFLEGMMARNNSVKTTQCLNPVKITARTKNADVLPSAEIENLFVCEDTSMKPLMPAKKPPAMAKKKAGQIATWKKAYYLLVWPLRRLFSPLIVQKFRDNALVSWAVCAWTPP